MTHEQAAYSSYQCLGMCEEQEGGGGWQVLDLNLTSRMGTGMFAKGEQGGFALMNGEKLMILKL